MKIQDAILKVIKDKKLSYYALAKLLGVQPIMITNYLDGSRMKQNNADKFKELFNITIDDIYDPTKAALERRKDASKRISRERE